MEKRSKPGGKPIKGRRRKTQERKRRNAPKAAVRSNSPAGAEKKEVARLTHELGEAREQQAASEILEGIFHIGASSKNKLGLTITLLRSNYALSTALAGLVVET